MTRGTRCDVCKIFYPDETYNKISKELTLHKRNHRAKVNHICLKCIKDKLGLTR